MTFSLLETVAVARTNPSPLMNTSYSYDRSDLSLEPVRPVRGVFSTPGLVSYNLLCCDDCWLMFVFGDQWAIKQVIY